VIRQWVPASSLQDKLPEVLVEQEEDSLLGPCLGRALGLHEDYDLEEEVRAWHREIEAIEPLASDLPAALRTTAIPSLRGA